MSHDSFGYSDPDFEPGGGWAPTQDAHAGEDARYDAMRQREAYAPLPGIHYARIDGKLQRVSAEVYAQSYGKVTA